MAKRPCDGGKMLTLTSIIYIFLTWAIASILTSAAITLLWETAENIIKKETVQ